MSAVNCWECGKQKGKLDVFDIPVFKHFTIKWCFACARKQVYSDSTDWIFNTKDKVDEMLERKRLKHMLKQVILRLLLRGRRPFSASQISKRSGIAYDLTTEYLVELFEEDKVVKKNKGKRTFWEYSQGVHDK